MLGLFVLFVIGTYLILSLPVIVLSVRWAKRRGRRSWVWGGVAAFAMYNLVFWDLVPTLLMHKYYCSTQAGFWVYKTPEQWVKENPGVRETLKAFNRSVISQMDGWQTYQFNQRLRLEIRQSEVAHAVGRTERLVRDISTAQPLIREVHFSLGWGSASVVSGGGLEAMRRALAFSWFENSHRVCDLPANPEMQFRDIEISFRSIGEDK